MQGSSGLSRLRAHFAEEITPSWGDAVLVLCCFTTGLLDAAVFNVWSCFVSMMTGNTVYVGLGVSGQPKDQPWRWTKSGTAILSFIVGSFLFSRLMRYLGPLRRSSVVLSFLLQAVVTYVPATLGSTGIIPPDAGFILPENFIVLLPIALLSLGSAGQCVMSRVLGFSDVTTVVLTSAYCDFAMDEKLIAPLRENAKRNRKFASMIMIACGATVGGFLTKGGNINNALWLAGTMKVVVAGIWCFWKAKEGIRLD